MNPGLRRLVGIAKWVAKVTGALIALGIGVVFISIFLAMGGVISPFPDIEITHEKPYADFVGRDYRVVADVRALAWNDFPDKTKILSISLMSPPTVRNRFVSSKTPLKPGQTVRIISAWKRFALIEFHREYVVSIPAAGLPDGIKITMDVNADGVPDPRVYEPIVK